uniref:Uncharacterized protein n=1 Tax=Onchocerca volvulus TaxID=6282 RepID=A0A8R1Y411_ONCVO
MKTFVANAFAVGRLFTIQKFPSHAAKRMPPTRKILDQKRNIWVDKLIV